MEMDSYQLLIHNLRQLGLYFTRLFQQTMSVLPKDEYIPDEVRQKISEQSLKRRFFSNYLPKPEDRVINVLQWNVLAQALSYPDGNFNRVKNEMVAYETRKWRILEQILIHQPDLCSLQEVDMYNSFLKEHLEKYGYNCYFTAKPNSKCLTFENDLENFKGPDGVLLCYKKSLFKEISRSYFELPNDGRFERQVFSILELEYTPLSSPLPLIFVGTHLKARKQFASSRTNQANALTEFLTRKYSRQTNIIVAGDFNGESDEPFYDVLTRSGLKSAYRYLMDNQEPAFTTWKFKSRESKNEREESRTIDYIFYQSENLIPIAYLEFPTKNDIGSNALPSANYPSDHLSLESLFLIRA